MVTRRVSGLCLACILALAAGGCPDLTINNDPTVTLAVDNTSISADNGVATITATLDAMSMHPVEIDLTFGGAAVSGVSYTRSATRIVIPSYGKTGSITIRGASATAYNPDAVVTVSIASVTNAKAAADQQPLSVTITSSATEPTVSLSLPLDSNKAAIDTFDKNKGTLDVTATLSNATASEVTVNLAFTGTAVNETDYTRTATSIVIPPGKTTGKITLTGVNPDAFVNYKSVIVTIDSVTNAIMTASTDSQQVTAYLLDSGPIPTGKLSLDKSTISAAGGVATVTCTLDKTIAADATVEFSLDVANSTAIEGTSFTISNKTGSIYTLTVPAGQTTGSITITGKQADKYLGNVTVVLSASNVTNLTPSGSGTFTITIQDTLPVPQVTLNIAGSPISENGGVATVTATLPSTLTVDTTVALEITPVSPATSSDYTVPSQPIKIASGQLSGSVQITAVPNPSYTGDKTVTVKVKSVAIGGNDAPQNGVQQGTIIIADAQTVPTVSLSLSSDLLYQTGGVAQVTARLSNPTSMGDVTVNLTFTGTAKKDTDYTVSGTSITIPPGSVEGAIAIHTPTNPNQLAGNTVIIGLGTITNATAGTPSQVTATLTDAAISLALTGSPVAKNGGVATLTATLSQAIQKDVTLQFLLSGTAIRDTDYTASDTKIVIPTGQTTGTLTLTTTDTTPYAGDKTITIATQSSQNAAVVGTSQFGAIMTLQWLADNAKQADVHVTASGLQYKILTAGPDPNNKPTQNSDRVTVNYTGTLIDGTVFDSNNGIQFQVGGVIPGWTEALKLMSVGSRWMLYIPTNLAYGDNPPTSSIPPNAVLIFDVTLVSMP